MRPRVWDLRLSLVKIDPIVFFLLKNLNPHTDIYSKLEQLNSRLTKKKIDFIAIEHLYLHTHTYRLRS